MIKIILLILTFCIDVSAQPKSELEKLVETEISFAKTSETKGTKTAFLEFLSDDAIVFQPTETNGKSFWQARPESPAVLLWRPNWADISADGNLGYTTGGWELRPQGKAAEPESFGQYATIWQRQPDGKYLAFGSYDERAKKPWSVRILSLADGEEKILSSPAFRFRTRWMPDSQSLVSMEFNFNGTNLWEKNFKTGERRQITNFNTGRLEYFDISPDGRFFVLSRGEIFLDAVLIER